MANNGLAVSLCALIVFSYFLSHRQRSQWDIGVQGLDFMSCYSQSGQSRLCWCLSVLILDKLIPSNGSVMDSDQSMPVLQQHKMSLF